MEQIRKQHKEAGDPAPEPQPQGFIPIAIPDPVPLPGGANVGKQSDQAAGFVKSVEGQHHFNSCTDC